MKKILVNDVFVILLTFAISRYIVGFFGIHFTPDTLDWYWQYLDVETLRHHLLLGVWYDPAQPPGFNLLLGIVLKLSGTNMPFVFGIMLKCFTLANVFLMLNILKQLTPNRYSPLVVCLLYLLSPATLIFENELFYTTYVSMLLLLSLFFLLRFFQKQDWINGIGVFFPLMVLCFSRTMYHLVWLMIISVFIVYCFRNKKGFRKLIVAASVTVLLVMGLYLKNYILFDRFSVSSWFGMNLGRNVLHDADIIDSTHIEAYVPFSNIAVYKKFISGDLERKFAGVNDRDLLEANKSSGFTNEHHIDYIEVSKKYTEACKQYIRSNPQKFIKNVMESSIIFFTPATVYPLRADEAAKLGYYDVGYSFNLCHFASNNREDRRLALVVSSIPKLLIYFFVFFILIRFSIRKKNISLINLTVFFTIGFVFITSSIFEHAENMRFRYEIEPLFLILLGQVIAIIANRKNRALYKGLSS